MKKKKKSVHNGRKTTIVTDNASKIAARANGK